MQCDCDAMRLQCNAIAMQCNAIAMQRDCNAMRLQCNAIAMQLDCNATRLQCTGGGAGASMERRRRAATSQPNRRWGHRDKNGAATGGGDGRPQASRIDIGAQFFIRQVRTLTCKCQHCLGNMYTCIYIYIHSHTHLSEGVELRGD